MPPPGSVDPEQDRDQLHILTILHYIFAALGVFGLCFLALHYVAFAAFLEVPQIQDDLAEQQFPFEIFDRLPLLYGFFAILGMLHIVLNIVAGLGIHRRRWRTFCIVVAAINCMQMPLGTGLGIFTIIVMLRPSVRDRFQTSPR